MSYLDKIVEANERLLKGELTMQVRIPYSLAAELAKKADAALTEGWKAERETVQGARWVITSPTGDAVYVADKVETSYEEILLQFAQDLAVRDE